jgi:Icc-related predicted phosphoesterase
MKITFISDTHNKHKQITEDLPGGDLLIHAGDISSMGKKHEIQQFCKWFDSLTNYTAVVFIAGNHDFGFEKRPEETMEIVNSYKWITYLQDNHLSFGPDMKTLIKIYGSPWQPEFHNWAFNLPKNGWELEQKWNDIPDDTDILITHGPAFGYCDKVIGQYENLGCQLLTNRIKTIKPKIHVCGHIHSGRNIVFDDGTLYINASVLDEQYQYTQKPITIDFDFKTGEWEFI